MDILTNDLRDIGFIRSNVNDLREQVGRFGTENLLLFEP